MLNEMYGPDWSASDQANLPPNSRIDYPDAFNFDIEPKEEGKGGYVPDQFKFVKEKRQEMLAAQAEKEEFKA